MSTLKELCISILLHFNLKTYYLSSIGKVIGSQCRASDGTLWSPTCDNEQFGVGNGSECVLDADDNVYRCACRSGWIPINRNTQCREKSNNLSFYIESYETKFRNKYLIHAKYTIVFIWMPFCRESEQNLAQIRSTAKLCITMLRVTNDTWVSVKHFSKLLPYDWGWIVRISVHIRCPIFDNLSCYYRVYLRFVSICH